MDKWVNWKMSRRADRLVGWRVGRWVSQQESNWVGEWVGRLGAVLEGLSLLIELLGAP